jgi:hypothetical protein
MAFAVAKDDPAERARSADMASLHISHPIIQFWTVCMDFRLLVVDIDVSEATALLRGRSQTVCGAVCLGDDEGHTTPYSHDVTVQFILLSEPKHRFAL